MVKIKLNNNGTLTVTFSNLTQGKFMNLIRALRDLSCTSTLAGETFEAVKRAVVELGFADLLASVN